MFTRRLLAQQQKQVAAPLVRQPVRFHQQWSKHYRTGFDRMLLDKLSFTGVGGHWFVLMGLANALAFAASHFMSKDQYKYHFAYTGERSSLFNVFKSMIGSDTTCNAIWTAPTLLGLGWYLNGKLGASKMTKFFGLTLFSSYIFLSALGPSPV